MLCKCFSVLPYMLVALVFESVANVIPPNSDSKNVTQDNVEVPLKKFDYYVSGFDYDNRPIIIMDSGKWDTEWLVERPDECSKVLGNYAKYVDELSSGTFKYKFNNTYGKDNEINEEFVFIKDYDNYDFRRVQNSAVTKLGQQFLHLLKKFESKLGYGFIINANPLVQQLMELSRSTVGRVFERIDIYGTNSRKWIPQLLRKIPVDQLPPKYGGSQHEPIFKYDFLLGAKI
ncbi:unnamed protein product [Allacma fusca]|uniref:CRAL-TRIO domain-containing protein n=1 Tax=Allacma fusca TaxID=39272 RepID=A0A8J2K8R4_9HEXA|nr:unnamed protein product [Allacma fusca]